MATTRRGPGESARGWRTVNIVARRGPCVRDDNCRRYATTDGGVVTMKDITLLSPDRRIP
jgi:hypothetical protein